MAVKKLNQAQQILEDADGDVSLASDLCCDLSNDEVNHERNFQTFTFSDTSQFVFEDDPEHGTDMRATEVTG